MSREWISTIFKPSVGEKRKGSEENNENNASKHFKENKEVLSPREIYLNNLRDIEVMAEKFPALSANIGLSWFNALSKEFEKDYFAELSRYLRGERAVYPVYPPEICVYSWTTFGKIQDVKVVILGQEPHYLPKLSHGLAFSVRKENTTPPSIQNIYKELTDDIPGFTTPCHGCLKGWASQGVLLLNLTLTVRAGYPTSHSASKWSCFTDAVIKWIDENLPNSVFMLWGKPAQNKMALITKARHLILTAAHPSPLFANTGFFGCRHFSKANEYLIKCGKKPIDWEYLP